MSVRIIKLPSIHLIAQAIYLPNRRNPVPRQGIDRRLGRGDPASAGGRDLRHEFQEHAGTELDLGYPYALALALISALLPLIWFRWKKWI
jgi:hypothetical protein